MANLDGFIRERTERGYTVTPELLAFNRQLKYEQWFNRLSWWRKLLYKLTD